MRVAPSKTTTLPGRPPSRRRAKFRTGFPIGSQFIILFALRRIAQNFVGLVDLLEFLLGLFFILRHVGMKFAGQFTKGLFDFRIGGAALHAEAFVIIFILNRHNFRKPTGTSRGSMMPAAFSLSKASHFDGTLTN